MGDIYMLFMFVGFGIGSSAVGILWFFWWEHEKKQPVLCKQPCCVYDEGGLPRHLRMGVNAQGQGPCDPPDPDFDHYVCWCGSPKCKAYID